MLWSWEMVLEYFSYVLLFIWLVLGVSLAFSHFAGLSCTQFMLRVLIVVRVFCVGRSVTLASGYYPYSYIIFIFCLLAFPASGLPTCSSVVYHLSFVLSCLIIAQSSL